MSIDLDGYAYGAASTGSYDTTGGTYIYTGKDGTARIHRGAFRFALAGLTPGQTVQSITLNLYRRFQAFLTSQQCYIGDFDSNSGADPIGSSAAQLYARCNVTTPFVSPTISADGVYNYDLGAAAVASLNAAMLAGRTFWAVALKNVDEASPSVQQFYGVSGLSDYATITVVQAPGPNVLILTAPKVISGTNEHIVSAAQPTFEFQYTHPAHTAGDHYQLQIDPLGGDFSSPLYDSGSVAKSMADGAYFEHFYGGSPALTANTTYKYRARAQSGGVWGAWSDTTYAHFIVNGGPDTPGAGTPTGGAKVVTNTPLLAWPYTSPVSLLQRASFIELHSLDDSQVIGPVWQAAIYDNFTRANGGIGTSTNGLVWGVLSGSLIISGNKLMTGSGGIARIDTGYADQRVIAKVNLGHASDTSLGAGVAVRAKDTNNYVSITLTPFGSSSKLALLVSKQKAGVGTTLYASPVEEPGKSDQLTRLEVTISGNTLTVWIGQKQIVTITDADFGTGSNYVGPMIFGAVYPYIQEFVATPLDGSMANPQYLSPPLTLGQTYKFRAKNYDGDLWSAISAWNNFIPVTQPTGTITNPTEGGTVSVPNPTITWTYSGNTAQSAFVLVLLDSTGARLWTSSNVWGSQTSVQLPAGLLNNNTTYKLELTVIDSDGLHGTTIRTFSTVWMPPNTITSFSSITATAEEAYQLVWTQGDIADADFYAYWIYRRPVGSPTWVKIGEVGVKTTPNYLDHYPPLNTTVEYAVTQVKNLSGALVESDKRVSPASPALRITSSKVWLQDVADPVGNAAYILYDPSREYKRQRDSKDVEYWGRGKPVRHYGSSQYAKGSLGGFLTADATDTAMRDDIEAVVAAEHIVSVRDPRGRQWYVYLDPVGIRDEMPNGYSVSLTWTEADY